MKARNLTVAFAALCLSAGTVAFAQSATPATPANPSTGTAATPATPAKKPTIAQRKRHQQKRIGEGVENGELTSKETKNLEKGESKINKEEKTMRSEDNGKLTKADRRKINRQQNRESKKIYRDKHNKRTQGGVAPAAK
jgi:hypothetical protein